MTASASAAGSIMRDTNRPNLSKPGSRGLWLSLIHISAATIDEYAIRLVNLLSLHGASPDQIEGGILGLSLIHI